MIQKSLKLNTLQKQKCAQIEKYLTVKCYEEQLLFNQVFNFDKFQKIQSCVKKI